MSDILDSVYTSALQLHNANLITDEVLQDFRLLCNKENLLEEYKNDIPMSKNIIDTIHDLLGTCNTFDSEGYTHKELDHLDSEIFLCDTCGWWCPIEEINEDNICTDCANEE